MRSADVFAPFGAKSTGVTVAVCLSRICRVECAAKPKQPNASRLRGLAVAMSLVAPFWCYPFSNRRLFQSDHDFFHDAPPAIVAQVLYQRVGRTQSKLISCASSLMYECDAEQMDRIDAFGHKTQSPPFRDHDEANSSAAPMILTWCFCENASRERHAVDSSGENGEPECKGWLKQHKLWRERKVKGARSQRAMRPGLELSKGSRSRRSLLIRWRAV